MKNAKIVKLASFFSGAKFWIAIIISLFESKGFQLSEVYLLVTFFSASIVFLEYPTGVIGDYFSHKKSVILGYIASSVALLLTTFAFSKISYVGIVFLWAFGSSLISGSDTALLHFHSKNFKKDVSDLKFISIVILAIATTLGSWIAEYNINYPIYLTAITQLIAGLILLKVPDTKESKEKYEGNIFLKAKMGIKIIMNKKDLLSLILIGATFSTLMLGLKWFYNTLFDGLSLPTGSWGLLVSFSMGLTALGSFIARKSKLLTISTALIFVLLTFSLIGVSKLSSIVIFGLSLYSFFHGYYDVLYEDLINKRIETGYRASILSAKNLATRILYALYTFLAGVSLNYINVFHFFLLTSVVVAVILLVNFKAADIK